MLFYHLEAKFPKRYFASSAKIALNLTQTLTSTFILALTLTLCLTQALTPTLILTLTQTVGKNYFASRGKIAISYWIKFYEK